MLNHIHTELQEMNLAHSFVPMVTIYCILWYITILVLVLPDFKQDHTTWFLV